MKSYEQTKDILRRLGRTHGALKRFYEGLQASTKGERMSMLLGMLVQHEENIEQTFERSGQEASRAAIETWHQYVDELELPDVEQEIQKVHDEDDVLELALDIEERLVKFYETIASSASVESVQVLFRDLYDLQSEKRNLLVRGAAELKDL